MAEEPENGLIGPGTEGKYRGYGTAMTVTRLFTFVGLMLVLLALVPLLMGRVQESLYMLGSVVVAGICLALWNLWK